MKKTSRLLQAAILLGKLNKTPSAFWATKTKEREINGLQRLQKRWRSC